MQKKNIIELFNGLNKCGNLVGQKIGYAIARNLQALKSTVEDIKKEQDILIENFGTLNKDGIKEIQFSHEEWKKLMDEDVDVKIHNIKLSDIPDTITAAQINGIFSIIEE